jgi:DNA mismatch endonuclease (patch repair protein)
MPKTRVGFWTEKFRKTVERDARKRAELEALGWLVLTVWECELNTDPQKAISRIVNQILEGS